MTPPPLRIVSLLPTATEMVYALGSGRFLVGRSQHCKYPPQVKSKPIVVRSRVLKVASQDSIAIHQAVLKLRAQGVHQFEIDAVALKRLKPDLLITQNLCSVCAASHSEVSTAIRHLSPRPKVVTLQAQRFDQVFSELKQLGNAIGREAQALTLIHKLQQRIERIRQQVALSPARPRVWCCEWLEPLMAAGHWVPELVECAGGIDELGPKGMNSAWVTWERIRVYDPEVIIVMPCSYSISQTLREKRRLTKRPGWNSLSAVKQGKVFAVYTSFYHRAGPRLLDGLELFAHLFHPDLLPAGSHRRHYRSLL